MDKHTATRLQGASAPAAWHRAVPAAGIAITIAGFIFYAGASYQRIDDINARLGALGTKVDQVDTSVRSIDSQVAEIAGALRMRRADSAP